jgi:polysaccharide biosynthesis/export protein
MTLCWMLTVTHKVPNMNALQRLLLSVAFLGACAFSSPVLADSFKDSQAYRLAPGDRISVTVYGQADFSGDILIDGEGNIILPLVGSIKVEDLTISECRKLIHDQLADGIINQPSVSVRISELRPVYVLGDVRAPGAYPFRYGSTVKSALAAAGGFGLAEPTQNAAISEFLQADERERQLTFQKRALLVRLERLEAQRDGLTAFAPSSPPSSGNESDLQEIISVEKDTFKSQAALLQSQLQVLHSQKPRIENEIGALNAQISSTKKQLTVIEQHVDQYNRLIKQGLGTVNTELQLKLAEATQESELWRLTAQISRLQVDDGELDLKIQDAEATFKRQIIIELREVRERLRELEVTLPSAREIREVKLRQASRLAQVEVSRSVNVTRTRHGQITAVQGTDTMLLEPGDVVEVKQLLPRDASSQNASLPQSDSSSNRNESAGTARPSQPAAP